MHHLFLKGLVVGFCIAVPVGPIAALCIQRTTLDGKLVGFVSGLGAAAADALYGALAAVGVTATSDFLMAHKELFLRSGGAVFCVLGVRLLLQRPRRVEKPRNSAGRFSDFFSTLILTLTNPMTFIAFAASFAALGVGATRGHSLLTAELVFGVLLGSALWWTFLVALVSVFRERFRDSTILWINRCIGAFVITVGILYVFVLHPRA